MVWVLVLLIVLAVAIGGGTALLSKRQKQAVGAANQVVPGTPTKAPASWAGSHDPAPRLHRRLRDTMTALRTADALDDGTTLVLRAELEQAALSWDDRLVAMAALPPAAAADQLKLATDAVASIESGVAQYISAATQRTDADTAAALAAARGQLDIAAEIRKSMEAS
ncbi:hypothetical protein [Nocardia sp. NBC_01388]|uniref:hypothetical protein n=1 Tax=Nocardia sp. NBC_01388 TaxID=2903596 RepID=UPI003249CD27